MIDAPVLAKLDQTLFSKFHERVNLLGWPLEVVDGERIYRDTLHAEQIHDLKNLHTSSDM